MSGARIDNSAFRPGTGIPGAKIAVAQPLATTAAAVSANIATFTMASNPVTAGFANGMTLLVAGFTGGDTYFNAGTLSGGVITGGYTILSVTSTTVSVALVHGSASASSNGTLLQMGDATHSCAGLSTVYTDASLSTTGPNPTTADTLGNYGFGVASGVYYVQVYGDGITLQLKEVVAFGSAASAGGADTQVQFNSAGNLAGSANLTYITGTQVLSGTILNATTGFRVAGGATSGNYLRGDGTNFISASIPAGDVLWNNIGNATGNLTLANGTNATTFNQTSTAAWTWANTTAATGGANQSSPILTIAGTYWTGAASAVDQYTLQNAIGAGTNPQTFLQINHTGSGSGIITFSGQLNITTINSSASVTSSTDFISLQTSAATNIANFNSGKLETVGTYWTGAASANDTWSWQNILGTGSNPTATLTAAHSGSSGAATVAMPTATVTAATPTGAAGQVGFGTTAGFGTGSAGTGVTTTTKGGGTGPTTAETIVKYLEIDIAGTKYWIPLVQ